MVDVDERLHAFNPMDELRSYKGGAADDVGATHQTMVGCASQATLTHPISEEASAATSKAHENLRQLFGA